MPDIMDQYLHLKEWETHKLHARYSELKATVPQSDDVLKELVCLARTLRTRASTENALPKSSAKVTPSLDML